MEPERQRPPAVSLQDTEQPSQGEPRSAKAGDRGDPAEHERLDEQLHQDPPPARAERAPHQNLGFARRVAREHQRRDVRANQQHEQHDEDV